MKFSLPSDLENRTEKAVEIINSLNKIYGINAFSYEDVGDALLVKIYKKAGV